MASHCGEDPEPLLLGHKSHLPSHQAGYGLAMVTPSERLLLTFGSRLRSARGGCVRHSEPIVPRSADVQPSITEAPAYGRQLSRARPHAASLGRMLRGGR